RREGPEADALSVRERAPLPPGDQLGLGIDQPRELEQQARLADSGDADERHELRRVFLAHTAERISEDIELAVAAYEGGSGFVRNVDAEAGARVQRFPDLDRLLLPFRLDG